jgi:heme-degrading monooxygenase HmoA
MDFLRSEADIERHLKKLRTGRLCRHAVNATVPEFRPLCDDGCVAKMMEGKMLLRIIRGKLKPGTWDAFERAYRAAISNAGPVEGLCGRWLVQDLDDPDSGSTISLWTTEEALRAYESSDLLKNAITAKLAPFFSGQYETRKCRVRFAAGAPAPDEWAEEIDL